MSLVGETDGVITRVPFHLECLRRHRGDRGLRSRIRAVVKMIDERNGEGAKR